MALWVFFTLINLLSGFKEITHPQKILSEKSTTKARHVEILNESVKVSIADATAVKGIYTLAEWNGMIPSISFTPDGKFIDKGGLRVL